MEKQDWYRKTTWESDDQRDFFARLARARGDLSKAQYLLIQASYLAKTGDPKLLLGALTLLDLMIERYPSQHFSASAYFKKAICLQILGRLWDAIQSYRLSFSAQRTFPNWRTDAAINFGMLVVRHELTELYDEALSLLEEFTPSHMFPSEEYGYFATKAILADYHNESSFAFEYAQKALQAKAIEDSGLRYHPKFGLVTQSVPEIDERFANICNTQRAKQEIAEGESESMDYDRL